MASSVHARVRTHLCAQWCLLQTLRRHSYFPLHLLHPKETCTKVDESQGKISACCSEWGWKEQAMKSSLWMPHQVLPFSFLLFWTITQTGSIKLSPHSFSFPLSNSLPFFLIVSEFPCGWCNNTDLKLLLWIVPLQKANKTLEERLSFMDLASTSGCIFLPWREGEAWGGSQDTASFSTIYFFWSLFVKGVNSKHP